MVGETEKCFDGDVRFTDSDDVDSFLAGGSDEAGFVQVMKGYGTDHDQMHSLDRSSKRTPRRSGLICSAASACGPDRTATSRLPTSRASARLVEGESKEPPAELAAQMGDFQALMANVEFIDRRDPWLF